MNRKGSLIGGAILIIAGLTALSFTTVLPLLGLSFWKLGLWRLWPLAVIGLGLAFSVTPLFARRRRGLGGLYIPGLPILATGGLLLFGSTFHAWNIWSYLWPVEILALALGFLLAAFHLRAGGLLIPAIIVGANGLSLQFCALTGRWDAWVLLWTLEPLSVGLGLFALNLKVHKPGLVIAGSILCSIAAVSLIGMSFLIKGLLWIKLLGPLVLIGIGLLLMFGALRTSRTTEATL